MNDLKRILSIFNGKFSKIVQHFNTQHSDHLGDRKWLRTDF